MHFYKTFGLAHGIQPVLRFHIQPDVGALPVYLDKHTFSTSRADKTNPKALLTFLLNVFHNKYQAVHSVLLNAIHVEKFRKQTNGFGMFKTDANCI